MTQLNVHPKEEEITQSGFVNRIGRILASLPKMCMSSNLLADLPEQSLKHLCHPLV